jgi:hypothetical protein
MIQEFHAPTMMLRQRPQGRVPVSLLTGMVLLGIGWCIAFAAGPSLAVFPMMLKGFGPLIGFTFTLFIMTLLGLRLLCWFEDEIRDDRDPPWDKTPVARRWWPAGQESMRACREFLSLLEHSPPLLSKSPSRN